MKKLLLTFALVAMGTVAYGQVGQTQGTLDATATIVSALTIQGTNFTFGNILQGSAGTVDRTTASAGVFDVTAAPNSALNIALTTQDLTHTDNSTLAVTYTAGFDTDNSVATQTQIANLASIDDLTTDATTGKLYIYIGGTTATTDANTSVGLFTATITLTASYN